MSSGSIDAAPLIWWTFGICLVFAAAVALVIRAVFAWRGGGRRGRLRSVSVVTDLHRVWGVVKVVNPGFRSVGGERSEPPTGRGSGGRAPGVGVTGGLCPPLKGRATGRTRRVFNWGLGVVHQPGGLLPRNCPRGRLNLSLQRRVRPNNSRPDFHNGTPHARAGRFPRFPQRPSGVLLCPGPARSLRGMRTVDWLTVLIAVSAGVLIPVLVIVARVARRSGTIEQKLDDLAASELEQDRRFADIFAALDRRLRWLEERIWGRDPRYPRGRGRGGQDPGALPVAPAGVGGRGPFAAGRGEDGRGGGLRGGQGGAAARVQDDPHNPAGGDHAELGPVRADLDLQGPRRPFSGAPLAAPSAAAGLGIPEVLVVEGADEPAGPPGVRVESLAAAAGRVVGAGHVDAERPEIGDVVSRGIGEAG